MKKKTLLLMLSLILIFSLTACSSNYDSPTISTDGGMLYLTMDNIEEEGMTGFYVMNEDNTFTPVMSQASGYHALGNTTDLTGRYLWFHDNDLKISELIPTVKGDCKLVFIYGTDLDFPGNYTLEKYSFNGYTIGCHIYRAQDHSLYLSLDGMLSGSDAGNTLASLEGDAYPISTINDSADLPVKNVDNSVEMMLGLEKGKYYTFEFYKGTKYLRFETIADTFIFKSEAVTTLQNPYTKTQDGYFYINLPENLKEGYYYICGAGLFKYED